HNIEPRYYRTLAVHERDPVKKAYYLLEAARLWRYEKILAHSDYLLTVSLADHYYYNRRFRNSILIPSSHPFDRIEIKRGTGQYILYHADLSVNENIAVAKFLIRKVFSRISLPCIIAGKNPPPGLESEILKHGNIQLAANPGGDKMDDLINNAQINIIPTMAANGLKLKLLISLFRGRHCLANSTAVNASGLYSLCHIADNAEDMIRKINLLFSQPFTGEMIEERKKVLCLKYDNMTNAGKVAAVFFQE
ncbi:MAG TPA: glycosyltransferase family 1 protein, partial [Bacteroidales bacterium]|nr:glycosyltransferase family 1 protein [Bacteroidales bacterium]